MEASHLALSGFTGRSVIGVLRTLPAGKEGQPVPGNLGPVDGAAVTTGRTRCVPEDRDPVVDKPIEPETSRPITPKPTALRGTPLLRRKIGNIFLLATSLTSVSHRQHIFASVMSPRFTGPGRGIWTREEGRHLMTGRDTRFRTGSPLERQWQAVSSPRVSALQRAKLGPALDDPTRSSELWRLCW